MAWWSTLRFAGGTPACPANVLFPRPTRVSACPVSLRQHACVRRLACLCTRPAHPSTSRQFRLDSPRGERIGRWRMSRSEGAAGRGIEGLMGRTRGMRRQVADWLCFSAFTAPPCPPTRTSWSPRPSSRFVFLPPGSAGRLARAVLSDCRADKVFLDVCRSASRLSRLARRRRPPLLRPARLVSLSATGPRETWRTWSKLDIPLPRTPDRHATGMDEAMHTAVMITNIPKFLMVSL